MHYDESQLVIKFIFAWIKKKYNKWSICASNWIGKHAYERVKATLRINYVIIYISRKMYVQSFFHCTVAQELHPYVIRWK